MTMDEQDLLRRIASYPTIFGGKPLIRGKLLTVQDVLAMLGAGARPEDILAANPNLELNDLRACLLYALHNLPAIDYRAPAQLPQRPIKNPEKIPLDYAEPHVDQKWPIAGRVAAICLLIFFVILGLDFRGIFVIPHDGVSTSHVIYAMFFAGTFISALSMFNPRRRTLLAQVTFAIYVALCFFEVFFVPGWP